MYTKVYGCACGWSSGVSVYFLIRCSVMWSYIFWCDCAKGFSMYVFTLIVNHFIVSRTYSVRYWLHLTLDDRRLRAYIIYVRGKYETNRCYRCVVGCAGTRTMLLRILWMGLCILFGYMFDRAGSFDPVRATCIIYWWCLGELFMYTNTDKAIDCLAATMWVAMFYMLMAW